MNRPQPASDPLGSCYRLASSVGYAGPENVTLRCPFCGHIGTFYGLPNVNDVSWIRYQAGARRCPNIECLCLVFVVLKDHQLHTSYPPEVIDFDSTNLPLPILTSLEEAIKAQAAGCHKAAVLMIRRVLEEMCRDKHATGYDLKSKIRALAAAVVAPIELLEAADELRVLGNDAAHVEAKAYDAIGPNESMLAIELAKELLKAVYQYSSLVHKLRALKKP